MIKLIDTSSWAQPLGWALVHSLWIGAFIYLISLTAIKFISVRHSQARYFISMAGLFAVLLLTIGAFLLNFSSVTAPVLSSLPPTSTVPLTVTEFSATTGWLSEFKSVMQGHFDVIVAVWITGVIIFLLRLAVSWWYVERLKRNSIPVDREWRWKLSALMQRLRINRLISLAESSAIQAPVVVGYMKPVILFPIGLFSGLTTAEVETILVHELLHIRRHDYLLNILQIITESILFFNPFVWLLSASASREREYCCDDGVLSFHGDALAYAYALTRLEEARLAKATLALSLVGEKNHLLNRIRRFMENKSSNYSVRTRVIPPTLLIIGLVCASFLTLRHSGNEKVITDSVLKPTTVAPDTIIKKQKSATLSKKKKTVVGSDGQLHEEVVEEFEGDEDLRPLLEDWAFVMPAIPDVDFSLSLPDLENLRDLSYPGVIMPPPILDFQMDTIPGLFYQHNTKDWEEFSRQFENKFKERFGEFYKKNQSEIEKMLEEIEEKFGSRFDDEWAFRLDESLRHQEEAIAKLHPGESWKKFEESMHDFETKMKDWEKDHAGHFKELESNMHHLEENMKDLELRMKAFESALKEQLIEDGYLQEGEKIREMRWDEEGNFEVNGIKIKPEHRKKYEEIRQKYLKDRGNFRYIE